MKQLKNQENQNNTNDQSEWKCISTLSKKRFDQIIDGINGIVNDHNQVEKISQLIQHIMQFDPNKREYSQENAKKAREKYKKMAIQQGKPLYEILGMKEIYLKRKKQEKEEKQKREKEQN